MKSTGNSKITAADINWPAEINETLQVTGWTKVQLAEFLGLYVQRETRTGGGAVCPHLYTWMRGKHKPKLYLLYALRYARLMHGQEPPIVANPTATPMEPVDEP